VVAYLNRTTTRWSAALANLMRASRLYLSAMLVGNFIWETLQLPLYTIWRTGTLWQQVFAVVVCTVEDLLIALGTLALALIIVGSPHWPVVRFKTVAVLVIAIGLAYTASGVMVTRITALCLANDTSH
jgi:hypothetical protein